MIFDILSLILLIPANLFFPFIPIFEIAIFYSLGIYASSLIILMLLLGFYILWLWIACQNAAQKVKFYSGLLALIVLFELIALSVFILFNLITEQSIQSQFLNVTSTSNLKDFIIGDPTGGISILIGIISIITVYLYFFTVLGKTKYFSELSDVQVKYTEVFWRFSLFAFIGGMIILGVIQTITKGQNSIDGALFLVGFINIIFVVIVPKTLKENFYNSNLSESEYLKKGEYNYKFLDDFQKEKPPEFEQFTSDIILIMTFMWAGLALFFNCNIFLLLVVEYSLLIIHFWSSQLTLIPRKKTTIELTADNLGNFSKITDVFILYESSKGYFIILDKNNQTSKIMKSSVHRLIDQKE